MSTPIASECTNLSCLTLIYNNSTCITHSKSITKDSRINQLNLIPFMYTYCISLQNSYEEFQLFSTYKLFDTLFPRASSSDCDDLSIK